jgi:hypothetical protein
MHTTADILRATEISPALITPTVNANNLPAGYIAREQIPAGAVRVTSPYPTWTQPLQSGLAVDGEWVHALQAGSLIGYSSDTVRVSSLKHALFIGYLNSLLSRNGSRSPHETSPGELVCALPFFGYPEIQDIMSFWTSVPDGLVCCPSPESFEFRDKITISYQSQSSVHPASPIDRVVNVADAAGYGVDAAAVLFYLGVKTVLVGNWIDVINFGATPSNLPMVIRRLIGHGEVKQHRTNKSLIALSDATRASRPESRWFAAKWRELA